MRSMSGVAVLALAFLVSSTAAFADTVTFNAGVNGSTSYTEAGMVFETGGNSCTLQTGVVVIWPSTIRWPVMVSGFISQIGHTSP